MALPQPREPNPPSTDGTPPVPEPPPALPSAAALPPPPPASASCVLASCVAASCVLASCVPPAPPAELPPLADTPPAAEIPPAPDLPPVVDVPPVAKLLPAAESPPLPLFPPLPTAPPVEGIPPAPPLPVDGVLFPPQDGRTTAKPDSIIPSRVFFICTPPGSSRRHNLQSARNSIREPFRPYSSHSALLRFTSTRRYGLRQRNPMGGCDA